MDPSVIVKLFEPIQCLYRLHKAVELVPSADGSLHNTVIRLYVGVLLWCGRFGELLDHFPVPEVLLYQLGHELTAVIVPDIEVEGQRIALENRVEKDHHILLADVPLDGVPPRGAPPDSTG